MPARLVGSLVVLALSLGHCAPVAQPRLATFHEEEYAPYLGTGEASITGQISFRAEEGYVTSGGGCKEVLLDPITSYTREWFDREVLKNERLTDPDPRTLPYRRTTQTDSAGHFRFEQLPPGSYYLACQMTWDRWVMLGTRPTMFEEVTWVHGQVTLAHGQQARIVLSH